MRLQPRRQLGVEVEVAADDQERFARPPLIGTTKRTTPLPPRAARQLAGHGGARSASGSRTTKLQAVRLGQAVERLETLDR